ncbi:MAG: hypothetical protein JW749_10400 [Sedimentisphaerales bacterium]|nr:hypothetical protein [Sedimentisphaerales bacterium]
MRRMLVINKAAAVVYILLACSFLTGCNPAKSDLAVFNARFEAADYNCAAQFAQKKIKNRQTPSGCDLLWTLQLAASERAQLNHSQSIACLDKAEEMLKYYDEKASGIVDTAGSTIVNDNVVPYYGEEYDGVMVNTYKALDFMAQNNLELARVELNRALDRQTRAKEHFNAEIRKLENQLAKQKEKNNNDVNAMVDDPNVAGKIAAYYPNLDQFQSYPDFVNPFTTYLAGLFFTLVGDYQKAGYLLKESYGMVPENDYIAKDLVLTDDVISGKAKLENFVWVIFENGLGPVREEVRIDLPLMLAAGNIYYTGVALPRLQSRSIAYLSLAIHADGGEYQTKQIADMERVIQTEFNKDFRGILARAIASAVVKAAAQYAVKDNDQYGLATAFLAVYTAATTAADVRIWSALPKDFQVARCAIPPDRKLQIAPAGGASFEINIPPCKNAIVYIKITNAGAMPVYEILTF